MLRKDAPPQPARESSPARDRIRKFKSDGVLLAFHDIGEGEPVLLIHGFGTTAEINWIRSGWVDELVSSGRRVLALDLRGHGESEKLYDPSGYRMTDAAEDAYRLLDHLAVGDADVVGYSMGARIAALLAVHHPRQVRSLTLGGMGRSLVEGLPPSLGVAEALEAASPDEIEDERGRLFRQFADRTGGDLKALAACMRAAREAIEPEALARLPMPILLAIGENDTIAGPIAEVAPFLLQAEFYEIPGRDHMRAVNDPAFRARVLAFLECRRG
jgi:pimeloyl-ACP methyl ester carboxylesterase